MAFALYNGVLRMLLNVVLESAIVPVTFASYARTVSVFLDSKYDVSSVVFPRPPGFGLHPSKRYPASIIETASTFFLRVKTVG